MTNKNTTPNQPLFQILSLDVVLGSLAVGVFATRLLGVNPNPWWWLILAVSVWVVYTLDHLVDGFKRKGESVIYRHRLHYQNRKILIGLVTVFGIAATILAILYLNNKIIVGGVILGLVVLLYQILNGSNRKSKNFFFQKELFIAVIYVCGIFLAPFIWYGEPITGVKLSLGLILIALAFAESVIISYFDFDQDNQDGLNSFTINFGKAQTKKMIVTFLAGLFFLILLCSWLFQKEYLPYLLILLMMDFILLMVIWKPKLFESNHLFRWIGESVFYLPALIVFF